MSARPQDVRSIDAIVRALYECISGRAGEPRDWDRFRALALPDARLARSVTGAAGTVRLDVFDAPGYASDVAPFLAAHDFHEEQTALHVERSGQVAHAWSRYEARPHRDSPELLRCGANSIQLWHDGARWWIVSVLWDRSIPIDERVE